MVWKTCNRCGGAKYCTHCNGRGTFTGVVPRNCSKCGGTGKCPKCGGRGGS